MILTVRDLLNDINQKLNDGDITYDSEVYMLDDDQDMNKIETESCTDKTLLINYYF